MLVYEGLVQRVLTVFVDVRTDFCILNVSSCLFFFLKKPSHVLEKKDIFYVQVVH